MDTTLRFPSFVTGNDLCEVNETEQIFTTAGTSNYRNYLTYAIISERWSTGIQRFKLQCISCAKVAVSIGIVSNLNAASVEWLFDSQACGHSYQMYLGKELCNGLYHFHDGEMITNKNVNLEIKLLQPKDTIELVVNFNTNCIQFYINSIEAAPAMQIAEDIIFYPAVAYVCSNTYYEEFGAPQYRLLCCTRGNGENLHETEVYDAKYVPIEDKYKTEYKAVVAYVKHIQMQLNLYGAIPMELIQIIYLFQQTFIIKGNDLCVFDPDTNILTTNGSPQTGNTFAMISKPLRDGMYRFRIECRCSANNAVAIGVSTDLYETIAKDEWFFDNVQSTDGIQMYLAPEPSAFPSAIYQWIPAQTNSKIHVMEKRDEIKNNDICEMIVDLQKFVISFWINSKQMGECINLQRDVTYYAAFTYCCNNKYFYRYGCKANAYNISYFAG